MIREFDSFLQQMNREEIHKPGEGLEPTPGTKPAGLAPGKCPREAFLIQH